MYEPGGVPPPCPVFECYLFRGVIAMKDKQNAIKWIGIAVTLVVLGAGVVKAFTLVQADTRANRTSIEQVEKKVEGKASIESVQALKAEVDKKADKAVVETELKYIRQGVDEIKTELKALRQERHE